MSSQLSYAGNDSANVKLFGATGDGTDDDTIPIQNAISNAYNLAANAGSGNVYFPAGNYKISQGLTVPSGVSLIGAGRGATTVTQVNTAVNYVNVRGMTLTGPASGTGIGIHISPGTPGVSAGMRFEDLFISGFGSHGVYADTIITTLFQEVTSYNNGADGFEVTSTSATSTSVTMIACYALQNHGTFGYYMHNMYYSSMIGCACDSAASNGYELNACGAVSLVNCGCETPGTNSFILSSGSGNSLIGCYSYKNNAVGAWVTGSEKNAIIENFTENSPTGNATASVKTDSGTSAVITSPTVTTAASYASGTAYTITYAGGTTH